MTNKFRYIRRLNLNSTSPPSLKLLCHFLPQKWAKVRADSVKMKEKKKKRSADNKVFSAVCLLTYEQRGIQSGIVDVPKTVSHKSIHRIPINIYPAVDPFLRRTSIKITQKLQDVHLSLGVAPWPRGRERQPKKKKKKKEKRKRNRRPIVFQQNGGTGENRSILSCPLARALIDRTRRVWSVEDARDYQTARLLARRIPARKPEANRGPRNFHYALPLLLFRVDLLCGGTATVSSLLFGLTRSLGNDRRHAFQHRSRRGYPAGQDPWPCPESPPLPPRALSIVHRPAGVPHRPFTLRPRNSLARLAPRFSASSFLLPRRVSSTPILVVDRSENRATHEITDSLGDERGSGSLAAVARARSRQTSTRVPATVPGKERSIRARGHGRCTSVDPCTLSLLVSRQFPTIWRSGFDERQRQALAEMERERKTERERESEREREERREKMKKEKEREREREKEREREREEEEEGGLWRCSTNRSEASLAWRRTRCD